MRSSSSERLDSGVSTSIPLVLAAACTGGLAVDGVALGGVVLDGVAVDAVDGVLCVAVDGVACDGMGVAVDSAGPATGWWLERVAGLEVQAKGERKSSALSMRVIKSLPRRSTDLPGSADLLCFAGPSSSSSSLSREFEFIIADRRSRISSGLSCDSCLSGAWTAAAALLWRRSVLPLDFLVNPVFFGMRTKAKFGHVKKQGCVPLGDLLTRGFRSPGKECLGIPKTHKSVCVLYP